ncbi:unnamed protein product [Linum trigynum]|uniref:Uncharacterized protein n=1 Tax=Linum trigynum TaxID=586398 RepID=A0AAV2DRA6_9ROSI
MLLLVTARVSFAVVSSLRRTKHQFVTSTPMGLPLDAYVKEPIDPDTGTWDDVLLEACFPSAVAAAIRQIPLRGYGEVDMARE